MHTTLVRVVSTTADDTATPRKHPASATDMCGINSNSSPNHSSVRLSSFTEPAGTFAFPTSPNLVPRAPHVSRERYNYNPFTEAPANRHAHKHQRWEIRRQLPLRQRPPRRRRSRRWGSRAGRRSAAAAPRPRRRATSAWCSRARRTPSAKNSSRPTRRASGPRDSLWRKLELHRGGGGGGGVGEERKERRDEWARLARSWYR